MDVESSHIVGHADAREVGPCVQFASDRQAGFVRGGADQLDDGAVADQRLRPPILADVGKQAVLDLVPLARARRQVVDADFQAKLVG